MTPAMTANVTGHLWTIEELFNAGIWSNLTELEARFAVGPTAAPH